LDKTKLVDSSGKGRISSSIRVCTYSCLSWSSSS